MGDAQSPALSEHLMDPADAPETADGLRLDLCLTPAEREQRRLAHLPYQPLDESDPAVAAVVRRARREAVDNVAAPSERLVELCRALADDALHHCRVVVMVRHPGVWGCATGGGGIWAVVSRLVNEAAATADRPHGGAAERRRSRR